MTANGSTIETAVPATDTLVDLMVGGKAAGDLLDRAVELPSLRLTERQQCDLELLMSGAFSPLDGFLDRAAYESVLNDMRLPDGAVWPMPITLDAGAELAATLNAGDEIALRDTEGFLLAVLTVDDVWEPDLTREAEQVLGTADAAHPAVAHLSNLSGSYNIGGRVAGVMMPRHYDYNHLRHTPAEVRRMVADMGWSRVVAFQTRNPMHRAHVELTTRAIEETGGGLLLHPVVGVTKPGDVDHFTRVRCYQNVMPNYPKGRAMLSLLPLAMRMAGPREALWHAIIRRNYGCTHFIVGRDHAGPGNDSQGNPFYGPYDAQEMVSAHARDIGIEMVPFRQMVYVPERAAYLTIDEVPDGMIPEDISGTELRRKLERGEDIPDWFSYPSVIRELRKSYPRRENQGFTVFFTGLSGSGKSTLANAVILALMERGRQPTLLDGDEVRTHLSTELGFSKEHRDLNIKRIGYVAKEITRHGGVAICAPIAPYAGARMYCRNMIEAMGGFVEVHVSTPLDVCEERDPKGLYAKARAGIVKNFTGIDDPYEEPTAAELVIDTAAVALKDAVDMIVGHLEDEGYVGPISQAGA